MIRNLQITSFDETNGWPEGTIKVEHNNCTLYLIPVVDGIEVDTDSMFHVTHDYSNEQFEITFFEIETEK